MRHDKNGTRLDIRFPTDIYEQIELLAAETNQPVHHISGKPTVTPLILHLVRIGIEEYKKQGLPPINCIYVKEETSIDEQSEKLKEQIEEMQEMVFKMQKRLNKAQKLLKNI